MENMHLRTTLSPMLFPTFFHPVPPYPEEAKTSYNKKYDTRPRATLAAYLAKAINQPPTSGRAS